MDYKIEEKVAQMLQSEDQEMHDLAIEMYFSEEPSMMDFVHLRNRLDPDLELIMHSNYKIKTLTQKSLIKIKDRIWGSW